MDERSIVTPQARIADVAPEARLADLAARLARLERSARRTRRLLGGLLVVAASVAAAGASPGSNIPDVLAARRFHIVDDRGDVVGRWVAGGAGTMRLETLAEGEVSGVLEVTANAAASRTPAAAPAVPVPKLEPASGVEAPAAGAKSGESPSAPPAEGEKKEREPFDWLD